MSPRSSDKRLEAWTKDEGRNKLMGYEHDVQRVGKFAVLKSTVSLLWQKRLFSLLNLDSSEELDRRKFDNHAVLEAIRRKPSEAREKYCFKVEEPGNKIHPIFMAIDLHASFDVIELLYDACPEALKGKNGLGFTPLHLSVVSQSPYIVVEFLLNKYPKALGRIDSLGRTALHYACFYDAPGEVVRLLSENHPKALEKKDYRFGKTPLHYVLERETQLEMVRCLVELNPTALEVADQDGWTPLHYVCFHDAPEAVVDLLAEKNPDALNRKDSLKRSTPLMLAEDINASPQLISVLKKHLADLAARPPPCVQKAIRSAKDDPTYLLGL